MGRTGTASVWDSRALRLAAVLTALNTATFVVDTVAGPIWPELVNWLIPPILTVPAALLCLRAAAVATGPAARHFWRVTALGMAVIGVALIASLLDAATPLLLGPGSTALQGLGGLVLAWAVFRLPMNLRTRAERAALALDLAILLAAAAIFLWHFFAADANRAVVDGAATNIGALMGSGLIGVLLAAKAVRAGTDTLPRRTLYLTGFGALAGGMGTAIGVLLSAHPQFNTIVLLNPIATFGVALSARFPIVESTAGDVPALPPRRYSVLPYAAAGSVAALLIVTAVAQTSDHLLVACAAVLIIALVILRQIVAFRENIVLLARLGYEASHDALTGLANRALFGERVAAGVAHPDAGHRFGIVLIDLDDFKTVNDTLGHAVGDSLLISVAARMAAAVRESDTVARLGGDEFAILFEGLNPDDVESVLTRIAAALLEPVDVNGHRLTVRASFGHVEGAATDDADDLLRRADIAMYEAKARGDGGYQRYRPGMEARGAERGRFVGALLTAIEDDQLVLHYQPVVTLPAGRFTGVEALVRWQHPERGLLAPAEFLPAAEESGLIVPLGRWVLREATRQAAAWLAEYGADGPALISVNASAHQLRQAGFAPEVALALQDSGLPARCLTIEITESAAVGGGAAIETLQALRALGVRLSLDDFGTGASTLGLLAGCPVDEIKLDRSFAPGPGPDTIAGAVLQLARALGVAVVAEGVETGEQAAKLTSLGYDHAQGHHFARPMTADQLSARYQAARDESMAR